MNEILKKRIEEASAYVTEELSNGTFKDVCIHNFEAGARFALTNQWISVDEAFPEDEEHVIALIAGVPVIAKGIRVKEHLKDIIAWMPIPKFNGKEDNK